MKSTSGEGRKYSCCLLQYIKVKGAKSAFKKIVWEGKKLPSVAEDDEDKKEEHFKIIGAFEGLFTCSVKVKVNFLWLSC